MADPDCRLGMAISAYRSSAQRVIGMSVLLSALLAVVIDRSHTRRYAAVHSGYTLLPKKTAGREWRLELDVK